MVCTYAAKSHIQSLDFSCVLSYSINLLGISVGSPVINCQADPGIWAPVSFPRRVAGRAVTKSLASEGWIHSAEVDRCEKNLGTMDIT